METKHTKEELFYTKKKGSIVVHLKNGDAVCDIWYDEDNEEEAEANAKLIASAPELLEALIKSQSMIKTLKDKLAKPKYGIIISGNLIEDNDRIIKKATE